MTSRFDEKNIVSPAGAIICLLRKHDTSYGTNLGATEMNVQTTYESINAQVASLNRQELKDRLLNFKGRLKLDFTETYLDGLSDDKLRHILMAVYLTEYGIS